MLRFQFNSDKSNNAILYICNVLGKVDRHKLMKILYFADRLHLVNYGRFITGDRYIAMKYGTVPSKALDTINSNQTDPQLLTVTKNDIAPLYQADMDALSGSDIECLNQSIAENKNLTFDELVAKSHGSAYNKTELDKEISIEDIAAEAGANQDMLKYIEYNLENQNFAL